MTVSLESCCHVTHQQIDNSKERLDAQMLRVR